MSKLYYQAIRALPKEYVDDATKITEFSPRLYIAVNKWFPPIAYNIELFQWELIEFKPIPPDGVAYPKSVEFYRKRLLAAGGKWPE